MKKFFVLFLLLFFFICFCICSCKNEVPVTEETTLIESPEICSFLCNGENVRLKVLPGKNGETYESVQWYETDKNGETTAVIEGETGFEYEVTTFEKNEIHYFVCKVSKGNRTETSKVFSVAHTGLPKISVETDKTRITKETWLTATLNVDGRTFNGKIKGRGNSTWFTSKKSYSLKLDEASTLFGMPEHKRWVLISNSFDSSLLRNIFASYLGSEVLAGYCWNPHFVFVDLVINGEYRGNFIFGEQIKISPNRIDISADNGGFLVEVNRYLDESFNFITDRQVPFSLKEPDEPDEETQQHVVQTIQNAENALFSDNFQDAETGYTKYFDVDSLIDWYLVNEITSNYDATFKSSVYMYYNDEDGKIYMGPNWDFDLSCGNDSLSRTNTFYIKKSIWFKRLFEDPAFEAKVKVRYSEVREELDNTVNYLLSETANRIFISALLNNERWKITKDFHASVDYLISWLNSRLAWLDSQWN